jgi:cell division transport system permease protein
MMATIVTLGRVAEFGLRNFLRNAWLSAAATAVMTVTLLLVITSYFSTSALNSTIKNVTDKLDVSVYLKDSVTPAQLVDLQNKFQAV